MTPHPVAPLRIGINCVRMMPAYQGGINSFALGLIDGFAASSRGHKFVLFTGPHNRLMFRRFEAAPHFQIVTLDGPLSRLGRGMFNRIPWRLRFRLPYRALGRMLSAGDAARIAAAVDVEYVPYCPTPIFPFPPVPSVYSFHDLQHVHYPQFFTPAERRERDAAFAGAVAHAALIQASGRQMAEEFAAHFPALTPKKIVTIPEGVDVDAFRQAEIGDVRARYGLPDRFLFYPAQFWPHKNHVTLLEALAQLRSQGLTIPLVLTGARYSAGPAILRALAETAGKGIFYLGVVPFADIMALHKAASFLVTPSLYESSSLPILEAAAAGTPIIASAIPAHREQAQSLQMRMFAPDDAPGLADLLRRAWTEEALNASQAAYNTGAVEAFRWRRIAERYLDSFELLCRPMV